MPKNPKALSRQNRRAERRSSRAQHTANVVSFSQEFTVPPVRATQAPIDPLNAAQAAYDAAIAQASIIFGIGPAGTGKTFLATVRAADALRSGEIKKIILVRPAVEAAGEKLGFLPGEMDDKYDPYLAPFLEALTLRLGSGHLEYLRKVKAIDARPMAYMRGASFDNTWLLADEMQNASKGQMEMLLTRIGKNSKFILSGDPRQTDLGQASGLTDAVTRLEGLSQVRTVRFTADDIVRSGLCQDIVRRYSR